MPTLERVAAGRSPRRLSRALARMIERQTTSLSPAGLTAGPPRTLAWGDPARVGLEGLVEGLHVAGGRDARRAPRGRDTSRTARAVRVRDVARGLLEIGHEPSPLEHLGQDIGRALAGDVHTAQLGHRVIAVLREHALVELFGARGPHGPGAGAGLETLAQELVEEKAAERLGGAGVAAKRAPLTTSGRLTRAKTARPDW